MKKIKINALTNLSMFLAFLPSFFSGIILLKILPSGNRLQGGRNLFWEENTFWSLTKHEWTNIHNVSSLIFSALILVHFLLHLPWLKSFPKIFLRKEEKK